MKKYNKVMLAIIIILILVIGVFIGVLLNIKMFNYYDSEMWRMSCYDGCSIATRNNQGLTNNTFECWNKCDIYINNISKG